MAADVLHAFIPTAIAFKDSTAEATGASLGGLSLFHPAAIPDTFKAVLKGSPFLGISISGGEWDGTRARLGFVHSSMVLGKKILAVEVIVDTFVARNIGIEVGIT